VFYVLSYSVLSIDGSYRPFYFISAGVEEYSVWAPIGFYDPKNVTGHLKTSQPGSNQNRPL